MANLIHIVGTQGVGKSLLAKDIIAGMGQRGKLAVALTEEGHHYDNRTNFEAMRTSGIRAPYQSRAADFLILEHANLPNELKPGTGDLVITLQRF